jgi:hypothetical protein
MRRALTTPELRRTKSPRDEFLAQPRKPITVVLDGITQNYNIGAIFRSVMRSLLSRCAVRGPHGSVTPKSGSLEDINFAVSQTGKNGRFHSLTGSKLDRCWSRLSIARPTERWTRFVQLQAQYLPVLRSRHHLVLPKLPHH